MSKEAQADLAKAIRESQNKITYFLMTAAGAGIGFSVTQTKDVWLSATQAPLGLAVFCWGLSFYFGCRYQHQMASHMMANYAVNEIALQGLSSREGKSQVQSFMEELMNINRKANRSFHLQFRLLILGAIFFVGWHVLEMNLRAHSPILGN